METTTNYNFNKPNAAEIVNIDSLNHNADLIDQSLKNLDDKITEHESDLSHIPYAVAIGSSNAYEVTISPAPTEYKDGFAVRVKISDTSTGASTLNVNGLGAKAIVDCYGNAITNEGLKANTPYIMCYESVSQSFIVQGKGGGGNATADQILEGATATVDGGPITGTMPNNGSVSEVLDINGTYTIPKGYHNGTGKVTQSIPTKEAETYTPGTTDQTIEGGQYLSGIQTILGDANLATENIKAGTSIFGVQGKKSVVDTEDGTATEDKILDGYTSYVNGSKVTGTMPNNGELDAILDINGTYTIPAGYTEGGTITQSIPTKEAATYTPGVLPQTIAAGQYLSGDQIIAGDADLITDNIKAGTNIFGVEGKLSVVDTVDATAGAGDIFSGKTVYVNGSKITGTMPNNGSVSQSLAINGSYTIPKGYHDGTGKVTQSITVKAADTYSPSTSPQTIAQGQYLSGAQVIAAVTGTATTSDVLAGKTFSSANGINLTGTATVNTLGGYTEASGTVERPTGVWTITTPFKPKMVSVIEDKNSDYEKGTIKDTIAILPDGNYLGGCSYYSGNQSRYTSRITVNSNGFSVNWYNDKYAKFYWYAIG